MGGSIDGRKHEGTKTRRTTKTGFDVDREGRRARMRDMGDGLRHSLCRWCYEKIPLETLCREAKGMGYEGIDLVGPGEFGVLKRFGLMGTMTPTHTIERGLAHKENWVECFAAIRGAIGPTADAGFPNVICFSGNWRGIDPVEGMQNCAEAIKQVIGEV